MTLCQLYAARFFLLAFLLLLSLFFLLSFALKLFVIRSLLCLLLAFILFLCLQGCTLLGVSSLSFALCVCPSAASVAVDVTFFL